MINQDRERFLRAMANFSVIYRQPADKPTLDIFWRLLSDFDIDQVERAFIDYMRSGRFMPTPAEIISRIPTATHLDKNEAWALCLRLATEEDTAIITEQMRDAWSIAFPIYVLNDRVGARMAFIEAYGRLVMQNKAMRWEVQGGQNKELKRQRVEEAVKLGRLTSEHLQIHQHSTQSISFDELTDQLRLNADTPSREKLQKNWARVRARLRSIRNDDMAELGRIDREDAENHREEVLARAALAMSYE